MKDLTTGSVTRHLVHMSAFLAMSMVVQTLYLLADLYWVVHLGKEAIAAVGVAGNVTMIVMGSVRMRRRRRWQKLTCSGFFPGCYCSSPSWLWGRPCAPPGSSSRLSDSRC